MYKKAEVIKEIRKTAKENGLTFKENGVRLGGRPLYKFVQRGTDYILHDNVEFWSAYEDCMTGFIAKLGGNAPEKPVVTTVEEYDLCSERVWIVNRDGVTQGGGYISKEELKKVVGEKKAEMIISNPAQDYEW